MSITRRSIMKASALAFVPATASAEEVGDPLAAAFKAYADGLADFVANAPADDDGSDAYADQSYAPPMAVLEAWAEPARTQEGAVAALECAKMSVAQGDCFLTGVMVAAAIGYLRPGARS